MTLEEVQELRKFVWKVYHSIPSWYISDTNRSYSSPFQLKHIETNEKIGLIFANIQNNNILAEYIDTFDPMQMMNILTELEFLLEKEQDEQVSN